MASDSNSQHGAEAPLSILSPGRVNIPRAKPLRNLPSAPELEYPAGFGHPELGEPGDFSRFDDGTSALDFKAPQTPSQLAKSESVTHFGSPSLDGVNSKDEFGVSKWSTPKMHARTHSDVQGMVARFNSLDIKDHADMRKRDAAALKRAQMGREEAEEEARKLREEVRSMKKEIEEGKDRERRVAKRLDVVMEDLHRTKETQAHTQSIYEKEIRKARKEAFKSSSALVKLQEDLKVARKALGVVQSDLDLERMKGGNKEQDAFAAQYQLIGVQEELAQAQARVKIAEEERDSLKMSLKGEEVTKIAAEGKIALPTTNLVDDEFGSPKRQPMQVPQNLLKDRSQDKYEIERLKDELEHESRRRVQAEEDAHFLKLECQFGCCACQTSRDQGKYSFYDASFEAEIEKFKDAIAKVLNPPESIATDENNISTRNCISQSAFTDAPTAPMQIGDEKYDENAPLDVANTSRFASDTETRVRPPERRDAAQGHPMGECSGIKEDTEDDGSTLQAINSGSMAVETSMGTLLSISPKSRQDTPNPLAMEQLPGSTEHAMKEQVIQSTHEPEDTSQEPVQIDQPYREITTTTKIPLSDTSTTPDYSAFCTPLKLTREEAIEQLRQRRGRARSAAGTPKKPLEPRRDISAPETRVSHTPGQVLKKSG